MKLFSFKCLEILDPYYEFFITDTAGVRRPALIHADLFCDFYQRYTLMAI